MKLCSKCGKRKPIREFRPVGQQCKICLETMRKERRRRRKARLQRIWGFKWIIIAKVCGGCNQTLPLSSFHKHSGAPDGLSYKCKECSKSHRRKHYLENRDKALAQNREWAQENREQDRRIRSSRAARRYQEEPEYRLRHNLRKRISQVLHRGQKAGSAVEDLGCSVPELMVHLEAQFAERMNWDNYGSYWEVDHIKPLAAFDLTNREQFLQATHFTNLQPLTGEENRLKSDMHR